MKKVKKQIRSIFRSRTQQTAESPSAFKHAFGEIVPPELFPNILYFVSLDDRRRETHDRLRAEARRNPKGFDLKRFNEEVYKAGPSYTLRSCSLVCLYWANRCRVYMFTGATVQFSSLQAAETFRKYAMLENPSLIPICTLIRALDVIQLYTSPRSFVDLLFMPQTSNKLWKLRLVGPAPNGFPRNKLDTPHWGTTNGCPLSPAVTSYQSVLLRDLHIPSFNHIVKYLKYIRHTEDIRFHSLTWDGKTPDSLLFSRQIGRHRRKITISVSRCTDDFLLCVQTAMIYSDFPLRLVYDPDQHWAIDVMRIFHNFYHALPAHGDGDSEERVLEGYPRRETGGGSVMFELRNTPLDHPRISLRFTCRNKHPATDSPRSTSQERVRVVGISIIIRPPHRPTTPVEFPTIDLAVLRKKLEERCSLRVVVLAFGSYSLMKALVEQYPTLRDPFPQEKTYLFTCYRTREHPFRELSGGDEHANATRVAIDPSNMEITGEQWRFDTQIVDALLNSR